MRFVKLFENFDIIICHTCGCNCERENYFDEHTHCDKHYNRLIRKVKLDKITKVVK